MDVTLTFIAGCIFNNNTLFSQYLFTVFNTKLRAQLLSTSKYITVKRAREGLARVLRNEEVTWI